MNQIHANGNVNDKEHSKPDRMTRRRLETRAKLLSATLKLVTRKGIDKTTMDDISEAADLGRRTLYYHFSSKEECILAAVTETYRQHAVTLGNAMPPGQDAALTVGMATQAIVAALLREPVTAKLVDHPKLLADAIFDGVRESAFKDIQIGIEQRRFKPPVRQNLLDNMMIWALTGVVIYLVDNDIEIKDELRDYAHMYLLTLGIDFEEAKHVAQQASNSIDWAS